MSDLHFVVFIGAAVHVYGTVAYLRDTVRGTTQPNRVSWFLWAVAPLIAFAAALSSGARFAALPVFMSGFGPILVFCASFVNKNAYWKLTKFDFLCGAFSLLAIVLWAITKNPAVAIIFSMLGDFFAGVPTIVKAWCRPASETAVTYATSLFSAFTGLFVVPEWTFVQYAFPIYLMGINSTVLFAIFRKRLRFAVSYIQK